MSPAPPSSSWSTLPPPWSSPITFHLAVEPTFLGISPLVLLFSHPSVILLKINQIISHTPCIAFLKAFLLGMNSRFLLHPPALPDLSPAVFLPWLSAHLLDPGVSVPCCLGAFTITLATAWNALPPGLQAANSFWDSDLLCYLPDRPSLITSSESSPSPVALGFPGGARGKEPTCQCRRCKRLRFNPWVRKIP